MKRFVAAFEDELVKLAAPVDDGTVDTPVARPAGAAPRIPTPTFHQSTGKPMGAAMPPPSNFIPASSAQRQAIPIQEMRSPPRQPQSDGWRPSPGFKPYAPSPPPTPAPEKGNGRKGPRTPSGPLRDRKPFESEKDYLVRKTKQVGYNATITAKNHKFTPAQQTSIAKFNANPKAMAATRAGTNEFANAGARMGNQSQAVPFEGAAPVQRQYKQAPGRQPEADAFQKTPGQTKKRVYSWKHKRYLTQ